MEALMKKIIVMVAVAIMTAMSVQAQIPNEVKDVLKKCSETNQHSGGTEMDFKLHVGAVITSMNGTMKIKYGVNDNVFVFDPKKYPNAVVVRK